MSRILIGSAPWHKTHLTRLLDWLFDEISSAGGDGDAAWILCFYDLVDVRTFIVEWLKNNAMLDWKCSEIKDDHFTVGRHQECLLVTTDTKHVPPWSQCTVEL